MTMQAQQLALAQTSAAARASVSDFTHAYYDNRVFDSYLSFASPEDEEEYRKREAQWREEIAKAQAEHTPQGDLRAANLAIRQLEDAGAHGADRSADFQPMLDDLKRKAGALGTQIDAAGKASGTQRGQQQAATAAHDEALDAALTPEVLASLHAAKIAVADQTQDGHGLVAQEVASSEARERQ